MKGVKKNLAFARCLAVAASELPPRRGCHVAPTRRRLDRPTQRRLHRPTQRQCRLPTQAQPNPDPVRGPLPNPRRSAVGAVPGAILPHVAAPSIPARHATRRFPRA